MREQSLAFLSLGLDVLLIMMFSMLFFGRVALSAGSCRSSDCPFFLNLVLPTCSIVGALVRLQAREHAFQILCILEILAYYESGIGICLHILFKIKIVLQNVVDESSHEGNICATAKRGIDISVLRRAREVRIDMNDCCSASFAAMIQRNPTGWLSAKLLPMIKMQSLFCISCKKPVAAPRPKLAPRPGTEALCHIRAWFSTATMPKA